MKKYAKKFFGSRRIGLVILGTAVLLFGKYMGWEYTDAELAALAGINGSGILALGMGDWGKEAAKADSED